jgi:hypothetical protein
MRRCIVNVATGHYVIGQRRLRDSPYIDPAEILTWADVMPPHSPSHLDVPYAFKAHAMRVAAEGGSDLVLWADACILPLRPLDRLWQQIETDGHWICRNGWANAEWTCDAAYPYLGVTPEDNWQIPHVVATAFGLNLRHPTGRAAMDEYLRLAQTRAFCGPWCNRNHPDYAHMGLSGRCAPCGPVSVRGHRHDQTALSVIAWKLGMRLTDAPAVFSYRRGETDQTDLVADGAY